MIRISALYFVAGYDLSNGNIAPIIKYMRGWSYWKIEEYCKFKNWKIEYL